MKSWFVVGVLLLLTACGYRFEPQEEEASASTSVRTIAVPYIKGDPEGKLTSELIHQLSASGSFEYVRTGGELLLNAVIVSDNVDRIGYRFDRHGREGKRRHRLVGIENRRELIVEISLIDTRTDTILLEPTKVIAHTEYDYIDPYSVKDLLFFDEDAPPQRTITLSLGQLDSIEGAQDDSSTPIYRHLAQKIVEGLKVYL